MEKIIENAESNGKRTGRISSFQQSNWALWDKICRSNEWWNEKILRAAYYFVIVGLSVKDFLGAHNIIFLKYSSTANGTSSATCHIYNLWLEE